MLKNNEHPFIPKNKNNENYEKKIESIEKSFNEYKENGKYNLDIENLTLKNLLDSNNKTKYFFLNFY